VLTNSEQKSEYMIYSSVNSDWLSLSNSSNSYVTYIW